MLLELATTTETPPVEVVDPIGGPTAPSVAVAVADAPPIGAPGPTGGPTAPAAVNVAAACPQVVPR